MNKSDHRRACAAHIAERFRHAARTLLGVTHPVYVTSINGWYDVSMIPEALRPSLQIGNGRIRLSELHSLVERMEQKIKRQAAAQCAA